MKRTRAEKRKNDFRAMKRKITLAKEIKKFSGKAEEHPHILVKTFSFLKKKSSKDKSKIPFEQKKEQSRVKTEMLDFQTDGAV